MSHIAISKDSLDLGPSESMTPPKTAPESPQNVLTRAISLRKALGLNQTEWCRRLGITTTQWSNHESGGRPLSFNIAMKIANKFGVSLDWLYRDIVTTMPSDLLEKLEKQQQATKKRAS